MKEITIYVYLNDNINLKKFIKNRKKYNTISYKINIVFL